MTRAWQVPAELWRGETVAILGNGPTMTQALADSLAGLRRIAVNRAIRFAPTADMFIALDPDPAHWCAAEKFTGLRVCGVECDDVDALYCGMFYETVTVGVMHTIQIRNNLLAAMRIAARAGAAKILLAGVDAALYDTVHAATGFSGFTAGLEQLITELRAQGIQVEHVAPVQHEEPAEPVETATVPD